MSHYLVTGGFGFIGSHLVELLLAQGHSVHVVDNLSTNPVPFETLMEEIGHHQLTYDLADFGPYPVRQAGPFDGIFHLASPVGPAGLLPHRGHIATEIVAGAGWAIRHARRNDCRLVFVSTSEVYGGGVNGLCREDMPYHVPAKPSARAEYAAGKLAAEMAVLNSDVEAVVVRPFNVAGPRQSNRGGFVLARFVEQAIKGEALTVFGDGSQQRAFTHVKDIAHGLMQAMKLGKRGETYNLGNPANRLNIYEMARHVLAVTRDGDGQIEFTNGKAVYGEHYEETADKWPDASKAMSELDWKPTQGINETILDAYNYAVRAAAWSR